MLALKQPIPFFLPPIFFLLFFSTTKESLSCEQPEDSRSIVNLERVQELVTLIRSDTPVAIVRFKTVFHLAYSIQKKEKMPYPATLVMLNERDAKVLNVEGEFSLVAKLYKEPPRLGSVHEKVPLDYWKVRAGNFRLMPFLRHFFSKDGKKEIVLLAVWPKKPKSVLDATFLGPLSQTDVKDLAEIGELLAKKPFPKIDQMDAEKFLESSNPWTAYLGLARLDKLKKLSAHHVGRVVKSLPASNSKGVIQDMFWLALVGNKNIRKDLMEELSTFFAKTKPDKQQRILKAVNEHLRQESYRELVNLTALQNAARKYRQTIINDPTRREVLREIDALLKLQEKITAS